MSTIRGIFEPFASYVVEQLKLRRSIIANQGNLSSDGSSPPSDEDLLSELQSSGLDVVEVGEMFDSDLTDDQDDPSVLMDQINIIEPAAPSPLANLLSRHKNFYSYVSERQCVIRMASGVNIKEKNNILNEGEDYLTGSNLAYNWILEGGIKSGRTTNRGGIYDGTFSTFEGFAYGDPRVRAEAADGFGDVPMPGIVDAEVNTKSEDGSLREARVNFVCFNRRQLEVLETLYMRPGYPIMLEWGWVPYINNDGEVIHRGFSMLEEFFLKDSNFDKINFAIKDQKRKTGGNYDGFVGFCKNFHFQAREDGGYDCTTEIIAQGEILESFKTPSKVIPKLPTIHDFDYHHDKKNYTLRQQNESVDAFLYYLMSIKSNLDQAGIAATLKYMGTSREEIGEYSRTFHRHGQEFVVKTRQAHVSPLNPESYSQGLEKSERIQLGKATLSEGEMSHETIETDFSMRYILEGDYYYYTTEDGEVIPLHELNVVRTSYVRGMSDIEAMVSDVTKTSEEDLLKERRAFAKAPKFTKGTRVDGWFSNSIEREGDVRDNEHNVSKRMRDVEGLGFESIYEGTILKEFSLEDENDTDSGIRKKIYLRWDLICQMFNRLIIPEYQEDEPIVELTYLTRDTPTYKKGTDPDDPKNKWSKEHLPEGGGYYIPYSKDNKTVQMPLDQAGLNDSFVRQLIAQDPEATEIPLNQFEGSSSEELIGGKEFFDKYGYGATINVRSETIDFPPLLGRSYDRNICIMPHQLPQMTEMKTGSQVGGTYMESTKKKNFTSFQGVIAEANSIGHVYFNLDYLITTYEAIALEEYKVQNKKTGEDEKKRRLKKQFSVHEFITTIWNGVNEACGDYYDFGLHTEHERPNIARIIDFTMSGGSKDTPKEIFEFNPQGLYSVTRENVFQSKLDNDFASVVSIAAQSPNEINSLEATSFKAFHKGITNRFTDDDKIPIEDDPDAIEAALQEYQEDYEDYEKNVKSLLLYVNRMNQSNYESKFIWGGSYEESHVQRPVSPSTAKSMASRLEDMRVSILSRYPEVDENGIRYDENHPDGHFTGQYRDNLSEKGSTTFNRNAIIPLTTTITLDGIAGINPLNIFKISSDKLPVSYKDPNIVFVCKKEYHRITAGQDWTVDIEGYLTLLNDNPPTGTNPTILLINQEESELSDLDEGWDEWVAWVPTVAWSAVFISWTVNKGAGISSFKPFSAHVNAGGYFELNKDTDTFEHLDPTKTNIRQGDILVYGTSNASKAKYPGPYNGSSHADIVTDIQYFDDEHYEISIVGGNVNAVPSQNLEGFQAVIKRTQLIKKDPNSSAITGKLIEQTELDPHWQSRMNYYGGSMLRAKNPETRNQIALAAQSEYSSWPKKDGVPVVETDPEAEEVLRKYWSIYPSDTMPADR